MVDCQTLGMMIDKLVSATTATPVAAGKQNYLKVTSPAKALKESSMYKK